MCLDMNLYGPRRVNLAEHFVLFACLIIMTSAAIMGDECDWTGSGLTTPSVGRGVTPVYLRCSTGKIKWLYPRGALRVLLRLPGQNRNFRGCIKMRSDRNSARLFLEGPRSLIPLYTNGEEGGSKAIRCFSSKNRQAAIYIEATDGNSFDKKIAEIDYDLQQLPKSVQNYYDPAEECRPCSSEELAHTFCTSDLVTRGTIHEVENNEELEMSQMNIKITKLIRHTTGEEYIREIETNDITDNNNVYKTRHITLNMPQHCGVSHGLGEFVFMARRKLGDLTLLCAPRLEDWVLLKNTLNEEGKTHCVLKS